MGKSKKAIREVLGDWKWILSYTKTYRKEVFLYTVLGVISISAGVVGSVASKYVIDIITNYQTERLALMLAIMVGTMVSNLLLRTVFERLSAKLHINLNNTIRADVFDKILDADWMRLSQYSSGDIVNRLHNDVQKVSAGAVGWIPSAIISGYQFLTTFFVILYYDKVMALIALASAPFLILSSRHFLKKQREFQKEVRKISSDVMAFEVETFQNYDTVKSFGIVDTYSSMMRRWQEKSKGVQLDYNWFSIKTNLWLTILGEAVQYVALGYGLYLLWSQQITFGTMALFLQLRGQLSKAFHQVVRLIPTFLETSVSAHRICELNDLPKEIHIEIPQQWETHAKEGFAIKMSDVSFAYLEEHQIFSKMNFCARPGEMVALIGMSGEGKTTLIRLLLGLIHPNCGEAVLQAMNGETMPVNTETRKWFSYVPQGNTVFSGTIAENLQLVKKDATEEEMQQALEIACAWDFVKEMPETIHTTVGEKGKGLSEGQAQRLAIARAILRDPPILLFDEATSALDVETEKRVLSNIVQHKSNKTCVIITHRPSVTHLCQRVYCVKDTMIKEIKKEEAEHTLLHL